MHDRRIKNLTLGLAVLTSLALTACGAKQTSIATSIPANAQIVQVSATDFRWTLNKATVSAKRPIDFRIVSNESAHGFSIVQTDISHTVVQGDKPINIVWVPPGPGRYIIRCNQFCGDGHDNMFTSITVR